MLEFLIGYCIYSIYYIIQIKYNKDPDSHYGFILLLVIFLISSVSILVGKFVLLLIEISLTILVS